MTTIAVIGQGYVGKAYADWFDSRDHAVIRYSLDADWKGNRDRVHEADLVIVAVPTPTTPNGQDISVVREAVGLARPGSTVVIKSTVLPGTTDGLQRAFQDRRLVHVPEFLRAHRAAEDVRAPGRMVIGETWIGGDCAGEIIAAFPHADFVFKTDARTAEFIKYASNIMLISKLVTANALYDAMPKGADWQMVGRALQSDPRIGPSHVWPQQGGKRGAGGPCFIKDLAAFNQSSIGENGFLDLIEDENRRLLSESGKDLGILNAVYEGDAMLEAAE